MPTRVPMLLVGNLFDRVVVKRDLDLRRRNRGKHRQRETWKKDSPLADRLPVPIEGGRSDEQNSQERLLSFRCGRRLELLCCKDCAEGARLRGPRSVSQAVLATNALHSSIAIAQSFRASCMYTSIEDAQKSARKLV